MNAGRLLGILLPIFLALSVSAKGGPDSKGHKHGHQKHHKEDHKKDHKDHKKDHKNDKGGKGELSSLGKPNGKGILIFPAERNQEDYLKAVGSSAEFLGKTCLVKVEAGKEIECQKLKAGELEFKAYFPDPMTEVTEAVEFSELGGGHQSTILGVQHHYSTGALAASELNTFTLIVGSPSKKSKDLLKLRAKIDQRIHHFEKLLDRKSKKKVRGLERLIAILKSVREKINQKIDSDSGVIARLDQPVFVEGGASAPLKHSSNFAGFQLNATVNEGLLLVGERAHLEFSSTQLLEKNFREKVQIKASFNGEILESELKKLEAGESLNLEIETAPLSFGEENLIKLDFYKEEDGGLKLLGTLRHKLELIESAGDPKWLSGPFEDNEFEYVKELPEIKALASDEQGKIDLESLSVSLGGVAIQDQLEKTLSSDEKTLTISGLIENALEGEQTISLEVSNQGGKKAEPHPLTKTFIIDRTNPVINLAAADGEIKNAENYQLIFDVVDLSPTTTVVNFNGAEVLTTADKELSLPLTLSEGENNISISSVDAAGNAAVSKSFTVTLDSTVPVVEIANSDGEKLNNSAYTLNATVTDIGTTTTVVSLNGNQILTTVSKTISVNATLIEEQNTFSILSRDEAGNPSEEKILTVSLDSTPPVLALDFPGEEYLNNKNQNLVVTVTEANAVTTKVYLNDVLVATKSEKNFTEALSLIEGENSIRVESVDEYLNPAVVKTLGNIKVDTILPEITMNVASTGAVESEVFSFQASLVETNLKSVVASLNANQFYSGSDLTVSQDVTLIEGENTFTIVAEDLAGNITTLEETLTYTLPSPPVASFTIDRTQMNAGETLTLDASSSTPGSAAIVNYQFSFSSGELVNSDNAILNQQLNTAGNIEIILAVFDANGLSATASETVQVIALPVNEPPTFAGLYWEIRTEGIPVYMDLGFLGANDPDGYIASFKYEFANGEVLTLTPEESYGEGYVYKAFTDLGTQIVKATVIDNGGAEFTREIEINVIDSPLPEVSLTADTQSGVKPLTVNFTATANDPDSEISSYSWDFNNGERLNFQTSNTASTTFTGSGTYNVRVKVRSEDKGRQDEYIQITVLDEEPTSPFGPQDVFHSIRRTGIPVKVGFAANNDLYVEGGYVTAIEWDFGDGNSTTVPIDYSYNYDGWIQHSYVTPGSYTVTGVMIDNLGRRSAPFSKVVDVLNTSLSVPKYSTDVYQGSAPLTVNFSALDSIDLDGEVVWYEWRYGDGGRDRGDGVSQVTHTFENPGTFYVRLRIRDNVRGERRVYIPIYVDEAPPQVGLYPQAFADAEPRFGDSPLSVQFVGDRSYDPDSNLGLSYYWDFGDYQDVPYSVRSQANPLYTYSEPGSFTATLWVQDADGNWSDGAYTAVYVNQSFDTEPTFLARKGNSDLSVVFDANINFTDGPYDASSIVWSFGDGQFGYETAYTEHYYGAPGDYVVSFSAREVDGEYKTVYKTVTVGGETVAPIANFTWGGNPFVGDTVFFDASGSIPNAEGDMTYRWNFKDGTYFEEVGSLGSFVEYSYQEAGNYNVELVVTNSQGLSEQYASFIQVDDNGNGGGGGEPGVVADFFCDNSNPLGIVCFDNSQITGDGNGVASRLWEVEEQTSTSPNANFSFSSGGTKLVRLTLTDNFGNSDTKEMGIEVLDSGVPTANFVCEPSGPLTLVCNDYSTDSGNGFIAEWSWSVDGQISADQNPTFVFEAEGEKTVSLVVTDNSGETASFSNSYTVIPNQAPVVQFSCQSLSEGEISCSSSSFDNDGSIVSYEWDVKGESFTESTIIVSGIESSFVLVSLTVTDDLGDFDTLSRSEAVLFNAPPVIAFDCSSTELLTLECSSELSDSDGSIQSFYWTVNNEDFSSQSDLSYLSSIVGEVEVTLTATDNEGKTSSLTKSFLPVQPPELLGRISKESLSSELPVQIRFSFDQLLGQELEIQSYEWKINGVIEGTESILDYTFENSLDISAELTLMDIYGRETVFSESVSSNLLPSGELIVSLSKDTAPTVATVSVTNLTDDKGISEYSVILPNGEIVTNQSSITFPIGQAGAFDFDLIIVDSDEEVSKIETSTTVEKGEIYLNVQAPFLVRSGAQSLSSLNLEGSSEDLSIEPIIEDFNIAESEQESNYTFTSISSKKSSKLSFRVHGNHNGEVYDETFFKYISVPQLSQSVVLNSSNNFEFSMNNIDPVFEDLKIKFNEEEVSPLTSAVLKFYETVDGVYLVDYTVDGGFFLEFEGSSNFPIARLGKSGNFSSDVVRPTSFLSDITYSFTKLENYGCKVLANEIGEKTDTLVIRADKNGSNKNASVVEELAPFVVSIPGHGNRRIAFGRKFDPVKVRGRVAYILDTLAEKGISLENITFKFFSSRSDGDSVGAFDYLSNSIDFAPQDSKKNLLDPEGAHLKSLIFHEARHVQQFKTLGCFLFNRRFGSNSSSNWIMDNDAEKFALSKLSASEIEEILTPSETNSYNGENYKDSVFNLSTTDLNNVFSENLFQKGQIRTNYFSVPLLTTDFPEIFNQGNQVQVTRNPTTNSIVDYFEYSPISYHNAVVNSLRDFFYVKRGGTESLSLMSDRLFNKKDISLFKKVLPGESYEMDLRNFEAATFNIPVNSFFSGERDVANLASKPLLLLEVESKRNTEFSPLNARLGDSDEVEFYGLKSVNRIFGLESSVDGTRFPEGDHIGWMQLSNVFKADKEDFLSILFTSSENAEITNERTNIKVTVDDLARYRVGYKGGFSCPYLANSNVDECATPIYSEEDSLFPDHIFKDPNHRVCKIGNEIGEKPKHISGAEIVTTRLPENYNYTDSCCSRIGLSGDGATCGRKVTGIRCSVVQDTGGGSCRAGFACQFAVAPEDPAGLVKVLGPGETFEAACTDDFGTTITKDCGCL